ncbi:hypothetical protein [Altererythrobacter sp. C41]|uniref:hypothetical protein n=1 Tax=Altererythrobacter sp. C41 TaxID=2806021 RepID=UPI001EE4568F|nr:hypothetical protein [Altererythrobacter sp. C41]
MHLLAKLVHLLRLRGSESLMATECIAYRDSRGELHATAERATLADLASVLGRVGEDGGMTNGVAKLIFDRRDDIERVFAEHDAILVNASAGERNPDVTAEIDNDKVVEISA